MKKIQRTSKAEWHKPELIVVNEPGIEARFGNYFAEGALYQGPYNPRETIKEHRELVKTLEKHINGVTIKYVKDVLLEGTLDNLGNKKRGKELDKLIGLADRACDLNGSELNLKDKKKAELGLEISLQFLHPEDLIDTILLDPVINAKYTGINTNFDQEIRVKPLYNQMFLRDQQIITDKGLVMGNMNSSQRSSETEITEYVFNRLGIEPITYIENPGKLEGGDFIPTGKRAFQGVGLRTNKNAVMQMLKKGAYGFDEVVVVISPHNYDKGEGQDEMHLDTVFNVLSEDKYVVLEDRIEEGGEYETFVKVYRKHDNGTYKAANNDVFSLKHKSKNNEYFGEVHRLKDYLLLHTGKDDIIEFSKEAQLAYAPNFLTIAPNKIVGIDLAAKDQMKKSYQEVERILGKKQDFFKIEDDNKKEISYEKLHEEFYSKLENAGVDCKVVNLNHLDMLYGGAHCLTQVFRTDSELYAVKSGGK